MLYAHKLTTTRRALGNPVALKVLFWSRGRLVTYSSFSQLEETQGSSGQRVSFSLIDVGSDFAAYMVISFPFIF